MYSLTRALAFIIIAVVCLAAIAAVVGCDNTTSTAPSTGGSGGSGLVITPRGGLGVDLGGGMYIDPSTGGVGIGVPIG